MRAIILEEAGGVENLIQKELDTPDIQSNEVLVKTSALSINPVDIKTRSGKAMYGTIKEEPPIILGWDISGEVTAVGAEVTKFKTGDEVFGMVNFPGHGKAYAEYVAVPEAHLAIKPTNISHQEAAAATLAALTAWQVLVQQAGIQSGQRVLIHAVAGGVGHFAVQIAKHFGAHVIGTASASKSDFLKALGTDEHVDYKKEKFEEVVRDIDIILDPVGGETTRRSVNVLKKGGRLISIVGGVKEEVQALAQERHVQAANYLVHSSGEDMEQLAKLLKEQKVKPHVSHQFPLDHIADAHRQIETGRTKGKVVINL